MSHPIVIMAFDKSPAITQAVAALEESGLEVVVLNTATAKLVDFLGALAGESLEDEPVQTEPEEVPPEDVPPEEVPPEDQREPVPTEDESSEEEITKEATVTKVMVDDESVILEIVDGSDAVLFTDSITVGPKTVYQLNETTYAFWPNADLEQGVPLVEGVFVEGDKTMFMSVTVSRETMTPPVLRIGRDHAFFKE